MSTVQTIKIDEVEYVRKDSIQQPQETPDAPFKERMKGKPVIARCRDAGVHFGYYVSHEGREVELVNSRRLWYWECQKGHSLSGVALHGIKKNSKVAGTVESILLSEFCELIPCTIEAAVSIDMQVEHNA